MRIFLSSLCRFGLLFLFVSTAAAKPAPSFNLPDWQGKNVSSQQLIGKGPVVINFWATWCIPCLAEMKTLQDLQERYAAQGLQVVSISVDDSKTAAKVPTVVRQRKFQKFTILLDSGKEVYNRFLVSNVPELFLLDSKGEIVSHHKGYQSGDGKKLEEEIQALLSNSSK